MSQYALEFPHAGLSGSAFCLEQTSCSSLEQTSCSSDGDGSQSVTESSEGVEDDQLSYSTAKSSDDSDDWDADPVSTTALPPVPSLRGILRKTAKKEKDSGRPRSLFPGIAPFGSARRRRTRPAPSPPEEEKKEEHAAAERAARHVSFYPRARVVPVPNRHDLIRRACSSGGTPRATVTSGSTTTAATGVEALWWTRGDYDRFKHTARILARTLVPNVYDDTAHGVLLGGTAGDESSEAARKALQAVWQDDHGDKWWCKFGHSRRGLEHITQIGVGKERQAALMECVASVIDEQRNLAEKMGGKVDPRRLAHVSMHYTRYARDAARHAGMEDEKAAAAVSGIWKPEHPPSPPPASCKSAHDPVLDANTSASIRRRARALSFQEAAPPPSEVPQPRKRRESDAGCPESMTRRAAGFGQRMEDSEYAEEGKPVGDEELRAALQRDLSLR